jgi:hypothetical protein
MRSSCKTSSVAPTATAAGRRSGVGQELEDDGRVVLGRGVANQAEAEPAGEEVVPGPLHGTAVCGAGAYS